MEYYFYSRVSTVGQNVNRQIENFKNFIHYNDKKLYIDKVQGNVPFMQRPNAAKMFDELTSNQTIMKTCVIDSIDRLGRNLVDILNTIELLTTNQINVKSIKEGFETLLQDGTENPMAKIVIACMGSIAELERNRIKQRVAEGIAIAKAKGKYSGRKYGSVESQESFLSKNQDIVIKLKKGLTNREISVLTGKSSVTVQKVRNVLYKRNELQPPKT